MYSDQSSDIEGYQTVTESGSVPKMRVTTAKAAYDIYTDLKTDMEPVAKVRARIQGLSDGNPPYDSRELRRLGQSHRTNVNFREMEAIIDTNAAAASQTILGAETLIQVQIEAPLSMEDSLKGYERIIAEEFTKALFDWEGFLPNVEFVDKETFRFGYAVMLWPDEWDWRPTAYKTSSFLFPTKAKASLDELGVCCIRDEMSLSKVCWYIENAEHASGSGWDISALKEAVINFYAHGSGSTDKYSTNDWESIQQQIKNNDPDSERRAFQDLKIIHLLVKESAPEGITHLIIADEVSPSKFLYKRDRRFPSMQQSLWLLVYDYGDNYLRSIKGLGLRAASHIELSNRFLCNTFDGAIISSSLLLQPNQATDFSKLQIFRQGPITIVPEALQVVQRSFAPPIEPLIQLRSVSSEILNNNTGVFRPRNENPFLRQAEKTAAQVEQEANKEARFNQSQLFRRYQCWDRWYREVFRRMTNPQYLFNDIEYPGKEMAFRFVSKCLGKEVPLELLITPGALKISATRAIGGGSNSSRGQAVTRLMEQRSSMDEQGRRYVEREYAAYWSNSYQIADRVFPIKNRNEIDSNETTIAALENNDFSEGKPVPVGSDQNHFIHASEHLKPLLMLAKQYQTNPLSLDIPKLGPQFQLGLNHIVQHVQIMAQDPTREAVVREFMGTVQALNGVFQNIQKVSGNIQQQQAQQEEARMKEMEELRQKADSNEVKFATEKYRIDREMELEKLKTENLNNTRIMKTLKQIEISTQKAITEMRNETMKAVNEIQNTRLKTQAKVEKNGGRA